jgi:hypothetical protein
VGRAFAIGLGLRDDLGLHRDAAPLRSMPILGGVADRLIRDRRPWRDRAGLVTARTSKVCYR